MLHEPQLLVVLAVLLGIGGPFLLEGMLRRYLHRLPGAHPSFLVACAYLLLALGIGAIVMEMGISYGAQLQGPENTWFTALQTLSMLLPTGLAAAHLKDWGDSK